MALAEYCQDINGLKGEALIERFCRLRQNADGVKRMMREKVEACRHELDEQYRIIFRDIFPDSQQVAAPATNSTSLERQSHIVRRP
jgi:hypothetical protein